MTTMQTADTVRSYERTRRYITIRGARQHNLKNVDLDLPKGKLIVLTGPSGSGKTSLAFNTIYAEGQRRYVESLSSYARQFLERMEKPDVDLITGLAPAIAIEQKTLSKNPRSTVATQTEIYDHLRLLYAQIGTTYSPISGEPVSKDSPRSVAVELHDRLEDGSRFHLCFPFPEHEDATVETECTTLRQRGFFRLLVLSGDAPPVVDLNESVPDAPRENLLVLVDRLRVKKGDEANLSRIAESAQQAFREGGGRCVAVAAATVLHFSERFERDGTAFREPVPRLFSFNSPLGACPVCQGAGQMPGIVEKLVIPDPDRSIRMGAIVPFLGERWQTYRRNLVRVAAAERIDIDAPYRSLPEEHKQLVWNGKGDYPGIYGFFRMLDEKSFLMRYRILASRFRGPRPCTCCEGSRLRREARYVRVGGLHVGEVTRLTIREAADFFERLELTAFEEEVAGLILGEIRKRLRILVDVGLDYLTLERPSGTLSGGESQRINLATSLGSSLVGSLYVLDEPTIGLHPRDTARLVGVLERLRDLGNTVIVVEHDPDVMRRADWIVDLGPRSGRNGGRVMFEGTCDDILLSDVSLTGAYLSGSKGIPLPDARRPPDPDQTVVVEKARMYNLKEITVGFPLGIFTCVTGVSGSGKSTLVEETLCRGLRNSLHQHGDHDFDLQSCASIQGVDLVGDVVLVDQHPIGRSPRSNPVTYTKAFDAIRGLLAGSYQARLRNFSAGTFSFNVPGGRCEVCQGEGVVKVAMQFLADLYLECEACKGRRYKKEVLEVKWHGKNVHDILQMTVDEAVEFFQKAPAVVRRLRGLAEVGLGYMAIGQPATTLSGGEAQRVKLASHLSRRIHDRNLYIFDEPTTGLHPDDIRKLLAAFDKLVDRGHTVVVVEHNMDVIKCADWVIDLGPEGGHRGGYVVVEGTPEDVARHPGSHTGRFLRRTLGR